MFEKKKLWTILATAALVAACGGGSNGGGTGGPGGSDGGSGGSGGGDNNNPPITSNDTTLQGNLQMAQSEQLVFNDTFQRRSAFEDTGESGGIFGQAKGQNSAPLRSFGFRVDSVVKGEDGQALPNAQEAVGRIAFSLDEVASTVGAGEAAESMNFLLTGVRLSTDANGTLSANTVDGAQLFVNGTAANGEQVNTVINIPAGTNIVRTATIQELTGELDPGSTALIFNTDAAFAAANAEQQAELAKLADLSGRFATDITVSAANLIAADGTPLVGKEITVEGSGQAPVTGAGVSGSLWLEMQPPAAPAGI